MSEAKKAARRWRTACAAAQRVPMWLAFRWCFAQPYNAHTPQGDTQVGTKRRAMTTAASLMEAMDGAPMAPLPPGMDQDTNWQAFMHAATALGPGQRRNLMAWMVASRWPDDAERRRQMATLNILMIDMQRQQRANADGWIEGVGKRAKRARGKCKVKPRQKAG